MTKHESAELLSIGQVVEELSLTSPDVTHSSLRFLEREGLLRPTRTPGGHRLYTRRDVDRIRQIKAWQAQRLSLAEIRHRLAATDQLEHPQSLSRRYLELALRGDQVAAAYVIQQADELGMPLLQIFGEVLQPALKEVGDCWALGTIGVGQEKEVSALTAELIAELSYRHAKPSEDGPLAIAACVAGERHGLGLQMIAGLLRAHGWQVHQLGVDVDARFLVDIVQLREPAVVLLSASLEARMPAIRATINALTTADRHGRRPWVVVGGDAIAAHAASIASWGATPVGDVPITLTLETLLAGAEESSAS